MLTVAGYFFGRRRSSSCALIWWDSGSGSARALGCLLILMTQYLTGGAWGVVIRRPLEAGAKTLYVMWLLFLPLLILRQKLYWWTDPAQAWPTRSFTPSASI